LIEHAQSVNGRQYHPWGLAELAEHKVALYVADLNDTVAAALASVTKMSRI
jgi:hypothetical protein